MEFSLFIGPRLQTSKSWESRENEVKDSPVFACVRGWINMQHGIFGLSDFQTCVLLIHVYSCFGKGCPKEERSRQCRKVVWEIFKIKEIQLVVKPRIEDSTTVQRRPTVVSFLDERVLLRIWPRWSGNTHRFMNVEVLSRYHATQTRPKTKGSLAMTLQVHHDFWYISPTSSAKHDIK